MEMAIELQGRINSSLRSAFGGASSQMQRLDQRTRQLRESQRALDEAYSRGQLSMRDYQERLRQLQGQLDRTGEAQRRLRELQEQRTNIQGQNDDLGGKAASTAAMATPIVGATMAAVGYADVQKQIRIQSNLTAQQSETAWEAVRQAHLSGLGEGVQETATAYAQMSSIIKSETGQQQQLILQGALAVEKYWGEAPESVSKAVHSLVGNFKELTNTGAMDIVTAGLKNGLNYANDYLDTLYEYAPQFDRIGYNAEQFYSVLAAGKDAGAFNLDKVADAFKEFNIRAKDGSKATKEGFTAIGLNATKMGLAVANGGDKGVTALNATVEALRNVKDPVKRDAAGVALFGTQWEDLTEKVILNMKVTDQVGKTIDGATKKVVDAATDAEEGSASWYQLARSLLDTSAAIGKTLLPTLSPMVQSLNKGANAAANFAEEHPGLTRAVALGASGLIGLRLATIGLRFGWNQLRLMGTDLRFVIEKVRNSQLLATIATKGLALAQQGLNLVMRMNPILKVISLIGGLIAIGVYLYKNFDTVREYVDKLWGTFKSTFPGAAEFIENVAGKVGALWDKLKAFWRWLGGKGGSESETGGSTSGSRGVSPIAYTGYASGGFANRPSIFAEAGPEAAIPLDGSRQSRRLWERTGELIGAGNGGTSIQVTFAPVIHGAGPEIIPALQEQQRSFMDQFKAVLHQERRVKLA